MYHDSTGKEIRVGSRVRFRGLNYTIKEFVPNRGRMGTAVIKFIEEQDREELADEISVDRITL